MIKEEIRIKKVIVHILDSTVGLPVLSDKEIEFGSDFADFLKEPELSPIAYAKQLENNKLRKRAYTTRNNNDKTESEW